MVHRIKRGDMFFADLRPTIGCEQDGVRPVLIIQNRSGNRYSQTVIIAILTSRVDTKTDLPTHVRLKAQSGLPKNSLVMLEQVRTIDKQRLGGFIGSLDATKMRKIDKALAVSMGLRG